MADPHKAKSLDTPESLADYLQCSTSNVYAMASRGEIPGIKIGRLLRFDREAVIEHFAGQTLSIEEAAKKLGLSEFDVSQAMLKGKIATVIRDRKMRITSAGVEKMLEEPT